MSAEKEVVKDIKNFDEKKWKDTYNRKAKESFETKYRLFVFHKYFVDNTTKIDELDVDDFLKFDITDELCYSFCNQYYQKENEQYIQYKDKSIKSSKITKDIFCYDKCEGKASLLRLTNDDYLKAQDTKAQEYYKKLRNSYKDEFIKSIFPWKEFRDMVQETRCYFCRITIDQICKMGQNGLLRNKRSDTRGYSLEVDRLNPNIEYRKNNCKMVCYWCNNAKTDEFTCDEFKEIAKGIRKAWEHRLSSRKIKDLDCNDI